MGSKKKNTPAAAAPKNTSKPSNKKASTPAHAETKRTTPAPVVPSVPPPAPPAAPVVPTVRVSGETFKQMGAELRPICLDAISTYAREHNISPDPVVEGVKQRPNQDVRKWFESRKAALQVQWAAEHNLKPASIVDITEEELNAMPPENTPAETPASTSTAAPSKPKAEKVETAYGTFRKGCEIHRIFEMLNRPVVEGQPVGLTVEEMAAELQTAHPEKNIDSLKANVRIEITAFRNARGMHVGRSDAGRYSVHIAELSRSRVQTPEQLEAAKKATEEKEAKKAEAKKLADEKKAEAAKVKEAKKAEAQAAKEKAKAEKLAADAAAKGVTVNVPGAQVVSAGS